MRVLLAAPTSNHKDYCFDDWCKMVRNLSYPNLDILLVDNSADESYYNKILEAGILCFRVPPEGAPPQFIAKCQNCIRDYFLAGQYDFLFSLETDVFVPKNIIEYMIGFQLPMLNISYHVTQRDKDTMCIQGMTKTGKSNRLKLLGYNEAFDLYDGEIKQLNSMSIGEEFQVTGTGIGCSLIRSDILEQQGFRVDAKKGLAVFSDSYFHLDLQRAGITDMLDTTIVVEHRRQDWKNLKFN